MTCSKASSHVEPLQQIPCDGNGVNVMVAASQKKPSAQALGVEFVIIGTDCGYFLNIQRSNLVWYYFLRVRYRGQVGLGTCPGCPMAVQW